MAHALSYVSLLETLTHARENLDIMVSNSSVRTAFCEQTTIQFGSENIDLTVGPDITYGTFQLEALHGKKTEKNYNQDRKITVTNVKS